ncbi:MAG: zinc dependent phospholipase C family protein [Lachnospiraceae bacterium]|jgi:hypothetical protein|nr:zinc dependent phospholipase C family protein [Lachnospiraceae bacterium]
MPAIFAHDTFGRIVYKELEGDLYWMLHKYQEYFRIGLQGPDFLFFYHPLRRNPVSLCGHRLHEEPAMEFFENAREIIAGRGEDSPHCAYILGVICHFALDSACHGYVEDMVRETGISHNEIETEFDRSLMLRAKLDPGTYRTGKLVPVDEGMAWVMSEFYEGVTPRQAKKALATMRRVKRMLHITGPGKERLVEGLMKAAGQSESLGGIVMGLTPNETCRPISRELFERFKGAVRPAVSLIYSFYGALGKDEPLSDRFDRNFL